MPMKALVTAHIQERLWYVRQPLDTPSTIFMGLYETEKRDEIYTVRHKKLTCIEIKRPKDTQNVVRDLVF